MEERFIFIEICSEERSQLCWPGNFKHNTFAVNVCLEDDFTLKSTVDLIIKLIVTKNVHVHVSTPCTAGCPYNQSVNWAKGNPQTRAKILNHWKIHDRMWRGVCRVIRACQEIGGTSSIEWSHRCIFHRLRATQKLIQKYGMVYRPVNGCAVGLKSICGQTEGEPLCKAWGFWTNNAGLAHGLQGSEVTCDKSHEYIAVQGKDTKHSGCYTKTLAKLIHKSLRLNLSPLAACIQCNL